MDALALSPETLVALVIAISFAAGLNVYATVFALGAFSRLHWVALPHGLERLHDLPVMVASGLLFTVEFFADKLPGFDVVWNVLHTFVRIPVAALLAYGAGSHLTPEMHALVTCLGAAVATVAHGSKTALRVAVTPSPEPVSNIALSTGEDGIAVTLVVLAFHHALLAASAAGVLGLLAAGFVWLSLRTIRRAWQSWSRRASAPTLASQMGRTGD